MTEATLPSGVAIQVETVYGSTGVTSSSVEVRSEGREEDPLTASEEEEEEEEEEETA